MARISFIQKELPLFKDHLISLNEKAFSFFRLDTIFKRRYSGKNIPQTVTPKKFIHFLIESEILNVVNLYKINDKAYLYTLQGASDYDIINAINRKGYFTHSTALHFHGLTAQIPKTIYLNVEQGMSNINKSDPIKQEQMDIAFSHEQRSSSVDYRWGSYFIILHRGKYSNQLGVKQIADKNGTYKITDLERSLIDSAVRPVYSGGVKDVLIAFELARDRVDIDKLMSYLASLNYKYPYHQCIGFYLERANYNEKYINKIALMKKELDFYLTYNIIHKEYDEKWKLYYPKGI